jgi:predicted AAA+ superfamily ATPase
MLEFSKIRTIAYKHKKNYPRNHKIYLIDIDGTICNTKNSEYLKSEPIFENIVKFNKLFEQGHEVHYWTARGINSGKKHDILTYEQLNRWGVQYSSINIGKPHYDHWIDDKAINPDEF